MKAVVAVDSNWGIGYDNKLLFQCKEDMRHFRELTAGKVVIMGKNTMLSLPDIKPLPGRKNIVLSSTLKYWEGFKICQSPTSLIAEIMTHPPGDIMIIGGSAIYTAFLPYLDTVYVTKFHQEMKADKFFPNLDEMDNWVIQHSERMVGTVNGVPDVSFYVVTYKNKNKKYLSSMRL